MIIFFNADTPSEIAQGCSALARFFKSQGTNKVSMYLNADVWTQDGRLQARDAEGLITHAFVSLGSDGKSKVICNGTFAPRPADLEDNPLASVFRLDD